MKDVERDEQQRQWFYTQLSSITHKMEGLNMADKVRYWLNTIHDKDLSCVNSALSRTLGGSQHGRQGEILAKYHTR